MAIRLEIVGGKQQHTASDVMGAETDFLYRNGIAKSGDLIVTEKPSPDMGVRVAAGKAYVLNNGYSANTSNEKYWRVLNDANVDLAIGSNSTGDTRIDIICVKVDTAGAPGDDGDNADIVVVAGTAGAGVPATPANHEKLAEVTVADGETSITDAEITDRRQEALFDVRKGTMANNVYLRFLNASGALADIIKLNASNLIELGQTITAATINTLTTSSINWDGWISVSDTWAYASWTLATRTGTITVPTDATTKYSAGMRVKITQATGGTKYGIIHKVEATTLTVFVEEGETLEDEAISSPHYSTQKAPFGFPMGEDTWTVKTTDNQLWEQDASADTWYNLGSVSLNIGVGLWSVSYKVSSHSKRPSASNSGQVFSTLSTANNSESDTEFTMFGWSTHGTSTSQGLAVPMFFTKLLNLTSATTYYLNSKQIASGTLRNRGDKALTIVRATSAYV